MSEAARPSERPETDSRIEFSAGDLVVDASILAELLNLPASRIPTLMRTGEITSVCERGIGEDDGSFRLTFFHGNRRARLNAGADGRIVRRSVIDFGDRPMPRALRQSRA